MKRKFTKLLAAFGLLALFILPTTGWGQTRATKTETFENQTASTTYNSTKTYEPENSVCEIGWKMYYGTVSTNNALSGSKSAQMRWYSTASSNRPYINSTTPIDNLSAVSFNARVGNNNVKMDVYYSSDGSSWESLATNVTVGTTVANFSYPIPSGGKYIKIGVSSSSTAPSSGNYAFFIDDVVFTYSSGGSQTVATPTFSLLSDITGTNLVDDDYVLIDCATDGASIYYTMGDNPGDPTTASNLYDPDDGIEITETVTIKAIAVKEGMTNSDVASITYTFLTPLTTMPELLTAATTAGSTPADVAVKFNNWIVVGTTTNNAYITDGQYGIVVYKNGHGFVSGNKLNGTAICKVQLFNNGAELTNLTASQLTVTTAETVTPYAISLEDVNLKGDYYGSYVNLGQLTYNDTDEVFTDGTRTIQPYNSFGLDPAPTFEDGKIYTVKGVFIIYKKSGNLINEIAPRVAADIVEYVGPSITFNESSFDVGNRPTGTEISQTFTVSQSNLSADIALTATIGSLSPSVITMNAEPTTVTWTYTPANAGTINATVTATSGTLQETLTITGVAKEPHSVIIASGIQNGTVEASPTSAIEGETITLTITPETGYILDVLTVVDGLDNAVTVDNNTFEMPNSNVTVSATFQEYQAPTTLTDELTRETTGVTNGSSTYTTWSNKTVTSTAVYAGCSAGQNNAIQLRTKNSNEGIITTASGGTVAHVAVVWEGNTQNGRILDVYGKSTAYDEVADLYDDNKQGTKLGSITCGTDTELSISGNYAFIGLRSNDGAMYLTSVSITWNTATAPIIDASAGSALAYNATEGSIVYEIDNYVTGSMTAATTADWISNIVVDEQNEIGEVSFTVNQNTGTPRTAIVTLTYTYDTDKTVTADVEVTQHGVPAVSVTPAATTVMAVGGYPEFAVSYESLAITNENDFAVEFFESDGTTPSSQPGWITDYEFNPGASEGYELILEVGENTGVQRVAYLKAFAYDDVTPIYSNLITITQNAPAVAGTWEICSLAELTPADVFVIVGTRTDQNYGGNYAMSNDNGTSSAPSAVAVIVDNSTLSGEIASNIQWNLSVSKNGYTFYPAGSNNQYLYCTNSNTGVKVGTGNAKHFTLSSDGYITTTETETQRYIGIYNNQDWRCYTSSGGNIANQTFAFYKKVSADVQYEKQNIEAYTSTNDHYYLIASPVASVTPNDGNGFFISDYDLYYFDESQEGYEWRNYEATSFNLVSGKGYLYASNTTTDLTFNGQPYNGNGLVELAYTDGKPFAGWNLIGNPFATAATLNMPFYKMNADGDDFTPKIEDLTNTISAMEGVFVQATDANQNAIFTAQQTRGGEKNGIARVDFNVTNTQGKVVDNAIVRFDEGQTLEKFMLNANSTKIFFTEDNKDYAIVRSEARGEMPVNFKAAENGTYTIDVEAENLEVNYLHLIDNLTGMDVDLLATPSYTFEARKSDIASRFRLVFDANTGNDETNDNFAFINNGELIVNGNGTVQVIDILGRQMFSHEVNSSFRIQNSEFAPGVYVLRLVNGNDVKTQKIVIK